MLQEIRTYNYHSAQTIKYFNASLHRSIVCMFDISFCNSSYIILVRTVTNEVLQFGMNSAPVNAYIF